MANFFANFMPLMLSMYIIVVSANARAVSQDSTEKKEEKCVSDDGKEYPCTFGHCCADSSCCTYYYELWWFWLIWTIIILMSCCCAYHHRKKRQSLQARRRGNNPLLEPYSAACSYPGPPVDKGTLGFCRLPKYDEIVRIPPSGSPPPPYRSCRQLNALASIETNAEGVSSMKFLSYNDITSSVLSLVNSVGFNFGRINPRERQNNQRGRPQSIQNRDELSVTDSFTSITEYTEKFESSSNRNSVQVIPCEQTNPSENMITEFQRQDSLVNKGDDDLPCSSTNHADNTYFQESENDNSVRDNSDQEEKMVPFHKPSIKVEVIKQNSKDRNNVLQFHHKVVVECPPLLPLMIKVQNYSADDNSMSSDNDSVDSVYCEVDENNNDSMPSVYLSPAIKTKTTSGKILKKLLR